MAAVVVCALRLSLLANEVYCSRGDIRAYSSIYFCCVWLLKVDDYRERLVVHIRGLNPAVCGY